MFLPPKYTFLSTTTKLVFNYDRNKFRYDYDFYLPSLTQDKLSTSEVEQFAKEADAIALGTMGKAIKLQKLVVAIFVFLVILLFGAAISDKDTFGKIMIGIIIAYFFCSIFFCIMYEQKRRRELSFRMSQLMNQHNGNLASRGWKWTIATHYNSIELNKEVLATTQIAEVVPTGLVVAFRQAQYTCGYNARLYTPSQTDNKFSKQEAEDFMAEVNNIAAGTIQRTGKLVMFYVLFLIVSFIIAIGGSIAKKDSIFKLGVILLVLGVLVGQAVIYFHYAWNRKQMESRMKDLIAQNNAALSQRGLGWYCPSSLHRVDLIRYYKSEEIRSLQNIDNSPQIANQEVQENGSAVPLSNNDVVLNLVEIPGYENIDNVSLIGNDNVRNNVSNIDETNDLTAAVNMYPVNDDYTNNNHNNDDQAHNNNNNHNIDNIDQYINNLNNDEDE